MEKMTNVLKLFGRGALPLKQLTVLESRTATITTTARDQGNAAPELPAGKTKSRVEEFREMLRKKTPTGKLDENSPASDEKAFEYEAWPQNTNPQTGEVGGPKGPEPTRYGDWERKGKVCDF